MFQETMMGWVSLTFTGWGTGWSCYHIRCDRSNVLNSVIWSTGSIHERWLDILTSTNFHRCKISLTFYGLTALFISQQMLIENWCDRGREGFHFMRTPFTYTVRRILSNERFDRWSNLVHSTMLESEPRTVPMRKGAAPPVMDPNFERSNMI